MMNAAAHGTSGSRKTPYSKAEPCAASAHRDLLSFSDGGLMEISRHLTRLYQGWIIIRVHALGDRLNVRTASMVAASLHRPHPGLLATK